MGEKATRGKNLKRLGHIFAIKLYPFDCRLSLLRSFFAKEIIILSRKVGVLGAKHMVFYHMMLVK